MTDITATITRLREWAGGYGAHQEGVAEDLTALLDALEGKTAALRNILHARPGGPCPNKLVEKIENIARDALEKFK